MISKPSHKSFSKAVIPLTYSRGSMQAPIFLPWVKKDLQVAHGDVIRRVFGGNSCREYGKKLADYFSRWGQYGVGVLVGLELMAMRATLAFQQGRNILSFGATDAFSAMYGAAGES